MRPLENNNYMWENELGSFPIRNYDNPNRNQTVDSSNSLYDDSALWQEELRRIASIKAEEYLENLEKRSIENAENELNNNGWMFEDIEYYLEDYAQLTAYSELKKLLSNDVEEYRKE